MACHCFGCRAKLHRALSQSPQRLGEDARLGAFKIGRLLHRQGRYIIIYQHVALISDAGPVRIGVAQCGHKAVSALGQ